MRIAYLSDSAIPSRKANSIQVMRMCEAFAAEGHDVTLFARPGDASITRDIRRWYGIEAAFPIEYCRPRGTRRLREWTYAAAVRHKLDRADAFDLCYGRHLPSSKLAGGNRPFSYEVHQPASRLNRLIERQLFRSRHLQQVVFISEALRRYYLDNYPDLAPEKTLTAHDAVNCPQHFPQPVPNTTSDRALRIGYSGSLHPARGINFILQLAAALPDMDFFLCGGEPKAVAELLTRTQHLRNLRISGYLQPSEVAGWQQSMDVLLAPYQTSVPTVRWMSPLKIFEFMASGAAIVASDLPVLQEILQHNQNALLVPPEDFDGWQQALRSLRTPFQRHRLARSAYETVRTQHTWHLRSQTVLPQQSDNGQFVKRRSA